MTFTRRRRAQKRAFTASVVSALSMVGLGLTSVSSVAACAGIEFLPGAGEPSGGASQAAPAPPPPPDPPAPARAMIAIETTTVSAAPRLVAVDRPEPDVEAIVKSALAASIVKAWRAYDDAGHTTARGTKARAELVTALTRVSRETGAKKEEAAVAAMLALGSLEGAAPAAEVDAAIAHYRQVAEKRAADTAMGWAARYWLAGLAPNDAGALYDSLVAAPPSDATRSWMPLLAHKPLRDWAKAATAFHALADASRDEKETRAARLAWMGAAHNAGDPKQALEAATAVIRDAKGAPPDDAIDVARASIDALGGVDRVQIALNPPELTVVLVAVARGAAARFDSTGVERAVKLSFDRAPGAIEAPVAASILAAAILRRGDATRGNGIIANARVAYAVRGPWGDALRASRKDGAPSDEAIEAAAHALDTPLPHASATEAEKKDEMTVRLRALGQACLGRPNALAKGAQFEIVATTYPDRAADVSARATSGEAAEGMIACVADRGPSFFEYAPASAKGTVVVAP